MALAALQRRSHLSIQNLSFCFLDEQATVAPTLVTPFSPNHHHHPYFRHHPDRCMGVVAEDREAAVLLTETNVRSHSMLGLPDCIFWIMTADAASTYFYLCFYVFDRTTQHTRTRHSIRATCQTFDPEVSLRSFSLLFALIFKSHLISGNFHWLVAPDPTNTNWMLNVYGLAFIYNGRLCRSRNSTFYVLRAPVAPIACTALYIVILRQYFTL